MTAKSEDGNLIFQRTVKPGSADRSYGVEVAKLAGVPESVIRRANVCLRELESQKDVMFDTPALFRQQDALELSPAESVPDELLEELQALNPDNFTPLAALNYLYELKKKVESHA